MKNGHSEFSALEYSKELKALGVPEDQANLQARQLELLRHEIQSNLVIKKDLEILENSLTNTLTIRVLMIVGLFATILGILIKLPNPA